MRVCKRVQPQF